MRLTFRVPVEESLFIFVPFFDDRGIGDRDKKCFSQIRDENTST